MVLKTFSPCGFIIDKLHGLSILQPYVAKHWDKKKLQLVATAQWNTGVLRKAKNSINVKVGHVRRS